MFREALAHLLDPLHCELEAVSTPLGMGQGLFDVEEELWIVKLFAQLFDERMDFRVDQKQLPTETGRQEEFFVQYA
ncbi:MAG TPA: hypothetical protein VHW45_20380, partial [Candidatus Sulfotelmatobacter sp.]|nr:hypothetical protein [Candidatus Sulfotelmatobacter sp.]